MKDDELLHFLAVNYTTWRSYVIPKEDSSNMKAFNCKYLQTVVIFIAGKHMAKLVRTVKRKAAEHTPQNCTKAPLSNFSEQSVNFVGCEISFRLRLKKIGRFVPLHPNTSFAYESIYTTSLEMNFLLELIFSAFILFPITRIATQQNDPTRKCR